MTCTFPRFPGSEAVASNQTPSGLKRYFVLKCALPPPPPPPPPRDGDAGQHGVGDRFAEVPVVSVGTEEVRRGERRGAAPSRALTKPSPGFRRGVLAALALSSLLSAPAVWAAAPLAGTKIGNSATATYTDADGRKISVTSNVVETVVKAVYAVDLKEAQSKKAPVRTTVIFPHLVTNTGNVEQTFALTAADKAGDDGDVENPTIYADANRDGVADSATAIGSTGRLPAGGTYGFVVAMRVPSGASSGDELKVEVKAKNGKPAGDADAAEASNEDIVTVDDGAVIEITKKFSAARAAPGDTVTVTLSYANKSSVASELVIRENLEGMDLEFVDDSVKWSLNSAGANTSINDGDNGTAADTTTLTVLEEDPSNPGTAKDGSDVIALTISSVPARSSSTVSFNVTVPADTVPGTVLTNYATYSFDSDGDSDVDSNDDNLKTNMASLTVTGTQLLVTIADAAATSNVVGDADDGVANLDSATRSSTDDDGSLNDVVHETEAQQIGTAVDFEFILTNLGSGAGRVNLSLQTDLTGELPFPAGTVFSILDKDGIVLTDTDGDGLLDLAVAAMSNQPVTIRAFLPAMATRQQGDLNVDDAWTARVTALPDTVDPDTGRNDPSDDSTLKLKADVGSSVDLINLGSLDGDGKTVSPGGDAGKGSATADETDSNAPFTTLPAQPGQTVIFKLSLTPSIGSSFNLEASSGDTRLTDDSDAGYGANKIDALPEGMTFVFKDTNGATISTTGPVAAGEDFDFEARVTVGRNTVPGNKNIRFRVYSTIIAGLEDQKLDRVQVGEVVDISLYPPESRRTIVPGQQVVHVFDLRNNGNIDITEGGISVTSAPDGFTTALHHDANGNGVFDAGEPAVDDIDDVGRLTAGASKQLILMVDSPIGIAPGTVVQIDVKVDSNLMVGIDPKTDGNPTNNLAAFKINFVGGTINLVTEQAVDSGCDGSADGAFNKNSRATPMPIGPGNCIQYKITATVQHGSTTGVEVRTRTPPYTALEKCTSGGCAPAIKDGSGSLIAIGGSVTLTAPNDGGTGLIKVELGDLPANTVRVLHFTVKVQE